MSQQIINISTPDDGLGDVLRNGFDKTNQNFTELYNGKVDKVTGKGLSENDFTDLDKAKLDGIEAGAEVNVQADWGETDPLAKSFILNRPPSLYSAFGYFHISDLATQTTPLSFVASTPLQLTNDSGGAFTNYAQAPYGVSDIWNTSTNQFEFEKLSVGDGVLFRADLSISTTSVNQNLQLYIKFGIGTPSEYDLLIDSWNEKSVITFKHFLKDVSFSIDNEDWRNAPAEIYILSDDDGSVKVNGWYIPIIRKSINIVDFNSDPLKLDKSTTPSSVYTTDAVGLQVMKPLSEFKDVLEFTDFDAFPAVGESGKIYVDLEANSTYRWTGSAYVQIGGINQDLYPIKYWYQATGTGFGTYGTNVMVFQGTQSDVYVSGNGNSYRKLASAATAGTSIFAREGSFNRVISNKGYQFLLRFRIADASTISDVRGFHGLQATSGFGNTDISANTQAMCGIGCDGTDTNIHIFSRQAISGTLVKIDTGFSKTLNHEYLLTQERLQNSNDVVFTLKNLTSSTEFTSTVVNNSSNLTIVNHRNNNASTLSCGFEIQRQELNLSE